MPETLRQLINRLGKREVSYPIELEKKFPFGFGSDVPLSKLLDIPLFQLDNGERLQNWHAIRGSFSEDEFATGDILYIPGAMEYLIFIGGVSQSLWKTEEINGAGFVCLCIGGDGSPGHSSVRSKKKLTEEAQLAYSVREERFLLDPATFNPSYNPLPLSY